MQKEVVRLDSGTCSIVVIPIFSILTKCISPYLLVVLLYVLI